MQQLKYFIGILLVLLFIALFFTNIFSDAFGYIITGAILVGVIWKVVKHF